jgi:hypothetical protein
MKFVVKSEVDLKMRYTAYKADSKPLDHNEWRLRESCIL